MVKVSWPELVVMFQVVPEVEVAKVKVGPTTWLIDVVAGADEIYPGLVQLKVSCPVEVVMLRPTPEVAKVKVGPMTWFIVVVAPAVPQVVVATRPLVPTIRQGLPADPRPEMARFVVVTLPER